ncbi:MAG: hypothetical protein HC908_17145, partial [Calothrix sp. SM1_7_51]|nr:hypothetical protein [Calothrix sp. SM1_7_51]
MSKNARINFRWRYQPRNKMDALMLNYISSNDIRSPTEMILLALRAFWLPLAVANLPNSDETIKKRVVNDACCTLINQINQIYTAVGFSVPSYLLITKGDNFQPSSDC